MALEIYKALSHTRPFDPRNSAAGWGERHADGGFHAGEENTGTCRVRGPGSPAAAKPWGQHSSADVVTPTLPSERNPCSPSAAGRDQDGTWTARQAPRTASWRPAACACVSMSLGTWGTSDEMGLERESVREARFRIRFSELRPSCVAYMA